MPEYSASGVYIEETGSGPRPIEGVAASTAAFVGPAQRGPAEPHLVTSWQEFVACYGDFVDLPPSNPQLRYLPYAAQGFFDNGGRRLYIARVTPRPAPESLS